MVDASNRTELLMQRRITRAYIDAEPALISLIRPETAPTASGGVVRTGNVEVIPAQKFRLIPFKRRLTEIARNTPDGSIHNLEYSLVGKHDADVASGDYFDFENKRFDVETVEPNVSFRQTWNITYRGPTDGS